MTTEDKKRIYFSGMYFRPKTKKQPDWVMGGGSINYDKLMDFLLKNAHLKNSDGFIAFQILESKKVPGTGGFVYDDESWKKPREQKPTEKVETYDDPPAGLDYGPEISPGDIPF